MTIVATLAAVATVSGTPQPSVQALAFTAPDPVVPTTDSVTATADYDGSLVNAALPGNGHQIVALRITVGGVELPVARVLPGASIQRARGERATFSIPLLLRAEWPSEWSYPMGRPESYYGPPPGAEAITIEGLYPTASGLHAVPLITNGISDNSRESWGQLDTIEINGIGPGGRYDRTRITLALPPGHGTSRGTLLGMLAAQAGVDNYAFAATGRVDKELAEVDAEFPALAEALLRPAGRVPHWGADGVLGDPLRVQAAGRFDFVLTERDLLLSPSVERRTHTEGPTKVTVTGTRQITRDGCGLRTEIQFVETSAPHKRAEAAFRQETSDGSLTARTPTEFEQVQVVGRVTTLKTYDCDRLLEERVITQGFKNPSMYRYEQHATTGIAPPSAYSNCWILDADAEAGDGALGYRWSVERFVTLSDSVTAYTYDDDGYEVGRTITSRGWRQRAAPIKEQGITPTPWEELGFIAGQEVLGSGAGVADLAETYFGVYYSVSRNAATNWDVQIGNGTTYVVGSVGVKREAVVIENDGGYKIRESSRVTEWSKREGRGDYLYEDGESPDSAESFRFTGSAETVNEPDGESSHARHTLERDGDGKITKSTREGGLDGYLPAAELAAGIDPNTENGLPASRSETQPITYTLDVPLPGRPDNEVTISDPWAENEAELERIARDEAAEKWAFKVTATIPACWLIRETHRALLRVRRRAGGTLVAPIDVKRVQHSLADAGSMWVTTIEGDQYVV